MNKMREDKNIDPKGKAPPSEDRKNGKKRKWAVCGAILAILVLLVLGVYQWVGPGSGGDSPDVLIGAGVKEGELNRGGENDETEANSNGKSEMTVRLNGYPVFADGESEGSLGIENPAVNELHMNVEITLDSTGEVIYDSGAIPPNHYVDKDKLAKALEKGTHEATAHVTLFDPEHPDSNYNAANFTLVITIEN